MFFISFQPKKNSVEKDIDYAEKMAISLKLSDRQIFALEVMRSNYARQINGIDIFNTDDATILRKLNSLYEKKVKLFLGTQLYERRVEFTKTFK